jgi:hypothetical protein
MKRPKVLEALRELLLEAWEELHQAAEEPLEDLEQLLTSLDLKHMMYGCLLLYSLLQTFSALAFLQRKVLRAAADLQTKLPYLPHHCYS